MSTDEINQKIEELKKENAELIHENAKLQCALRDPLPKCCNTCAYFIRTGCPIINTKASWSIFYDYCSQYKLKMEIQPGPATG